MATKNLISLDKGKHFVKKYKDNKKKVLKDEYKDKVLPVCETFDRAAFDKVLGNPGCVGIRVYFGMNEELGVNVVIVGVNAQNEDILTWQTETTVEAKTMTLSSDDEDPIIENGTQCPVDCPPPSGLNP